MAKKGFTFKGEAKPFGKTGHFNEPRRHSLQAKGFKTGHQADSVLMPAKKTLQKRVNPLKFPILIKKKDYDINIQESGEANPEGIIVDVIDKDPNADEPILDTYTVWYDDFDSNKQKAMEFAKKTLRKERWM